MIKIHAVNITPGIINTNGTVKIVARVSDVSWENLRNTNTTWADVKSNYTNWEAVKQDNRSAISWNNIKSLSNWNTVKTTYFDWFGVLENIKK